MPALNNHFSNGGRPLILVFLAFSCACTHPVVNQPGPIAQAAPVDSIKQAFVSEAATDSSDQEDAMAAEVHTGQTRPADVVQFAETLIGTRYVFGSADPRIGLDCSGFITYVFSHFHIVVPRSSIDFTHVGKTVAPALARAGDLILFTGTNPMEANIGHMGLVVNNGPDGLFFIHSTSGKAMGVTIAQLDAGYQKRFVRICRVFPGE